MAKEQKKGIESSNFKKQLGDYSFLQYMKDDQPVYIQDVIAIFNISIRTLDKRISKGSFPECDFRQKEITEKILENSSLFIKQTAKHHKVSYKKPSKRAWKTSTIIAEIRKINESHF